MQAYRICLLPLAFSLCFVGINSALAQEGHFRTQNAPNLEQDNQAFKPAIVDLVDFLDAVIVASQKPSCEEMSIAVQSISAETKMRAARTIANIDDLYISDEAILEIDAKSSQIAKAAISCPSLLLAHKNVATIANSLEKHQKESTKNNHFGN